MTCQLLTMISHVLDDDFVEDYRQYLQTQPLDIIRELTIHLMHMITDLASIPSHYLVSGTPSLSLFREALLDFLYNGSMFRPSGKF